MSEGTWLACVDCKVMLPLGRAVKDPATRDIVFIAEYRSGRPARLDERLDRVLWKMLAEHPGHRLEVVRENSTQLDDLGEMLTLGEDEIGSPTLEEYLAGWPG
ncbi:hypothetical protein [Longispora fulva]|uniref:Uncharacterized protein n=1 Tax=Longispora fulva TaxID=619741 RepID=A0A8J7GGR1_9ACTN|nr:hypothetical protein [Longispora fulva]MBG6134054.1 hypothetical protein [Longispora fulva]